MKWNHQLRWEAEQDPNDPYVKEGLAMEAARQRELQFLNEHPRINYKTYGRSPEPSKEAKEIFDKLFNSNVEGSNETNS